MYKIKQDLNIYPPAKSNGDTNRELVDIEIALAREFHFEKNIIVFNVHGESWVLPLFHECDMVVVSPKTRLLSEFEIKRTWSDFCADFKKNHRHEAYNGLDVASFSYVVPEGLFGSLQCPVIKLLFYIVDHDDQHRDENGREL